MKWILHYLRGIVNVGLVYYRDANITGSVIDFACSNYVADKDQRKIMIDYIFTLSSCIVS